MKAIGIEINGSKTIFYALEKDRTLVTNITGEFKSVNISDVYNNTEIKEFQATVFSFFDNLNPHKIAIIKRNYKGQQSASPISFKLEGLIQCYSTKEIEFIHPATLNAFYKKNVFPIIVDFKYQHKAAQLAFYLLER